MSTEAPPRSGPRPSRIGGPEAWLIWVLATTFVVWLFAIQTGYAVVSPEIQTSANLTLTQIGLAASIYTWVFAVMQFFSGPLLDRFGTRPLLAIGVTLVAAGAFLYASTDDFATLATAQAVLAIGASFGFVGAGYVGGRWFDAAKYGLMFGLVQAAASLGSAFGQPLILAALKQMDWQQLLVGFGVFGLLLALLFVFIVRDPVVVERTEDAPARRPLFTEIVDDFRRCFANRNVVLAALFGGASFGTMLALGTLWGPRVMEAHGASSGFATILTALAWLGLAIGAPLVNVVSGKRHSSRRRPAITWLSIQAIAITLVIYLPSPGPGVAATLMFAVGLFSGVQMLGFTVAGESVAPSLIGSASAVVNGVCFIIGGLLTSIPSALLPDQPDIADFRATLWLLPAVLVVGIIAAIALRERPAAPVAQTA